MSFSCPKYVGFSSYVTKLMILPFCLMMSIKDSPCQHVSFSYPKWIGISSYAKTLHLIMRQCANQETLSFIAVVDLPF